VTHELRCRAASLALPNGAAITGRSAATVRGVRTAWPEDPVEILAPPEMRLGRRKVWDVRRPWAFGLIATPMRLTLDLLLGRPLADVVAGSTGCGNSDGTSCSSPLHFCVTHGGWCGPSASL
jgi:hypothetical protein